MNFTAEELNKIMAANGGNLDLSGSSELTELPKGFKSEGDSIFSDDRFCLNLGFIICGQFSIDQSIQDFSDEVQELSQIESKREAISVSGDLNLSRCRNLAKLPDGLAIGGNLDLSGCYNLENLPRNLIIGGNLRLWECENLQSLPEGLIVFGDLDLTHCVNFVAFPKKLYVGGELRLIGSQKLAELPGSICAKEIFLINCKNLAKLPSRIAASRIYLSECPLISEFPPIEASEELSITCCANLKKLPDDLEIGGNLDLRRCSALAELPEGLTVDGWLNIDCCSSLRKIPDDLIVKKKIIQPSSGWSPALPRTKFFEIFQSADSAPDIDSFFEGIEPEMIGIAAAIWHDAHISIRKIRETLKLTQKEFSERFMIPKRTIGNWENNTSRCPLHTRLMLADYAGLCVFWRP